MRSVRDRWVELGVGFALWLAICGLSRADGAGDDGGLLLEGVTVTPHVIAEAMRYAQPPDPQLGARVQLFLRNGGSEPVHLTPDTRIRLRGQTPAELLAADAWSWHDFPSAWPDGSWELPAGALTVWSFNGKRSDWGVGTRATWEVELPDPLGVSAGEIEIAAPRAWISAITFLAGDGGVVPETMFAHVANETDGPLRILEVRLWLPEENGRWRTLRPGAMQTAMETRPTDGVIPPHDKGIVWVNPGPLPLGYAAVELRVGEPSGATRTLWGHLRVKREAFDISGGWVQDGEHGHKMMTFEPFLKTLRRMHVNTAHLADQYPGYTDQTQPGGLYERYPLKFFNALTPTEKYESADMLPRIHAVEFLGEPQYGGGRPVAPKEVWQKLAPYQATKLPTTVTHSEERIWRYYAGLSDYPHYDAYRVNAPSPDAWSKYDRWGKPRILWGSPLETIGDMCRSLRELNRPMPTAIWSQGPHRGWDPSWGRRRASPTPDELRMQAYHALSSRITSLYWFNLSLPSLIKYRDTIAELTRVGREMRLLEEYYLAGDAYRYERVERDGKPDWDLASIAAPEGALLFALDLDYQPDKTEKVFKFGPPREAKFRFDLPVWARQPAQVFRIDADGCVDVAYTLGDGGIEIADTVSKVTVYVVAVRPGQRAELEARRQALIAHEQALAFDPAVNDQDFEVLVNFVRQVYGK